MAWNKSNNDKTAYVDYAGNLISGYVGYIPVQSGVSLNNQTVMRTSFIDIYGKPKVPESESKIPYYQGKGAVLIVAEKKLSNGYTYPMPVWSDVPLCSTNFPTGIQISGYLYQPIRMRICNAGANYTVDLLGRIV